MCEEGFGEYLHSDAWRGCVCSRCWTWQLIPVYSLLFRRGEEFTIPSSVRETSSSASTGLVSESSFSDTYCSPPRPLPYDDPRYSRLQRDRLVSQREKSSNNFEEESQPLRGHGDTDIKLKNREDEQSGSELEGESKLCYPSSLKHGATYDYYSYEEEDVCPTCLEEYTSDNPRIVTQCSHHFHLGCIYEWMERSESCPVCGKMMVFDETS